MMICCKTFSLQDILPSILRFGRTAWEHIVVKHGLEHTAWGRQVQTYQDLGCSLFGSEEWKILQQEAEFGETTVILSV